MIAPIFVALAAPIALGALCGIMNERSGVVNIGIEGMMLSSAFTAFLVAALVAQAMGPIAPSPIFGATIPILVGVAAAVAMGMLVSLLHAWLSISIRADQIISGTIINILAFGLTGYLNRLLISPNPRLGAGIFQPIELPGYLVDLPFIGWILRGVLRPRPDHDLGPVPCRVPPDLAFPLALGAADPGRRGASKGGRDGWHQRDQAPLPERHPGWHLRRDWRVPI